MDFDTEESNAMVNEDIIVYSFDKIEDNLYLGCCSTAESLDRLKELNIGRVLSITDFNIETHEGIVYKHIEAFDHCSVDLLTRFPECIEFITEGHNCGQNVYVHCAAGISRSPTIVIAFLMHKYKITYENARKLVSDKRNVHPNEGFKEQLKLFELMNYTIDVNRKEYTEYLSGLSSEEIFRDFYGNIYLI